MMPVASAPINGIGTFGDGSLIDQVLRALDTVLSPLASSTERASANQFCESVKEDVGQSLHLAVTFVPFGNGYSPAIRQFGLNLLESIVKRLGQSSPLVEQGFLQQLWGLAFGPTGLDADRGETRTVKEKMAVVLVQAAVRVWPQRWTQFFEQLMAEAGCIASPTGPQSRRQALNAELALTVIRMLIEEIQQAGDSENAGAWDAERKQELQNAMALVMPEYAAWLWGALPTAAARSRPDDAMSMAALQTLVRAWTVALASITLPAASSPLAFATLFNIAQIYTGSLQEDALDALLAFSARPLRTGEEVLVTGLLDQEAERFEQLFATFVKEASSPDEDAAETAYGHLKRTAEMLVNFGTMTIGNKKHPSLPKKLDRILGLLLELLGLPSLIIRSLASLFWMSVSRGHDRLWKEQPELLQRLPALFMRILGGLATDKRTDRRHRWNRLDFDTERDFEEVSAAAFNRLQCLLEAMAGRHVGLLELLGQAMASFCSDSGNAAALRGASVPAGPFAAQWSALSVASEAVCRGVGSIKEDDAQQQLVQIKQQSRSLLDALLSGVVEPSVTATDTLLGWLAMVRALAVLLAQRGGPEDVPSGLLHGMLGLALGETQFDPHVKGRVGALLLRLATVSPTLFHPHLEALASSLEASCNNASGGSIQRQRLATELLLAVGGTQSVECVDRAVRPVLEELERATPWLTNPQSFRQATVPENSPNQAADSAEFRRSLGNLLALIFIIAQRLCSGGELSASVSEYVRGSIGPRLTGALLGLLTTLQSISRPGGVWTQNEEALWHDLFARRQPDATNVLAALDPVCPAASDSANSTSTLRGWFSTVTVSALVSLGLLAKAPGFFADTRLIETVWAPYLAAWDATAASPWALSWLLKHALHPLLVAANISPTESLASLTRCPAFSSALDSLFSMILSRLQSDWTALDAGAAGSPEEELERESELIMLSSALLNLAYDVLFPMAERSSRLEPFLDLASRQPPSPVASPISHWLATANPERMVTILRLIVASLGWRPSVGTSKSFVIALRWIPVWAAGHPAITSPLLFNPDGPSLFHSTLITLTTPSVSDLHPAAAQLAGELYKYSMLLGCQTTSGLEPALSSLPTITPNALTTFREALTASGAARSSAKQHREAARTFFRPVQQAAASQASGRSTFVQRLPEKLLLIKKLKVVKEEDEVTAEDIDALFA